MDICACVLHFNKYDAVGFGLPARFPALLVGESDWLIGSARRNVHSELQIHLLIYYTCSFLEADFSSERRVSGILVVH